MVKLIISLNALIFSFLSFFGAQQTPKPVAMPMCSTANTEGGNQWMNTTFSPVLASVPSTPVAFKTDTALAYSMPTLSETPKGDVLLSWVEKDNAGVSAFCMATSTDKGKTFSDKKVIFAGNGVGSSRLFRSKVLAKKDGSFVAVFSVRGGIPQPNAQSAAPAQGGKGGGRSSALVFTVTKDGGATWTPLQAVDSDPSAGMRGFYDATVLANDEIAVAYLKDVKNSTKHEERDLRLAITKNGVFQPEKLLDAVVCDCCNVNLSVDNKGAFTVFYRDNNDNIRDISRMTSKDNGETFSQPENVYKDGWQINGCPHNGVMSAVQGNTTLAAWYSGGETETGFRVVTKEGKKLFIVAGQTGKNPALMSSSDAAALLWENQIGADKSELVFRHIKKDKVSELKTVEGTTDAVNSTGMIVGNQMLVAHEVKMANKKNGLKISTVGL
jgi:hypothetical protein